MTIPPLSGNSVIYETQSKSMEIKELTRRSKESEAEELRKVSEDFESLFVKMMLDSMRSTLDDNGLIPKNSGEKLFEDHLFDEYARKIGSAADFGIAEMMYNQLSDRLPGSSVNIQS